MKCFCAVSLSLAAFLILVCPINSMSQNANNYMNSMPEDFRVEYQWIAGSVPPPYHYEFIIRIKQSGEGEVVYYPDYTSSSTPEWKERFTVSREQLKQLYKNMESNGFFTESWQAQDRHIIGGSYELMTVTVTGKKIKIPAFVVPEQKERTKAIYAAIRTLTPKTIWTKLEAQRQVYIKAYKKR